MFLLHSQQALQSSSMICSRNKSKVSSYADQELNYIEQQESDNCALIVPSVIPHKYRLYISINPCTYTTTKWWSGLLVSLIVSCARSLETAITFLDCHLCTETKLNTHLGHFFFFFFWIFKWIKSSFAAAESNETISLLLEIKVKNDSIGRKLSAQLYCHIFGIYKK